MPHALPADALPLTGGFWDDVLQTNAQTAIFHQWKQLEKSGCIENFRIAAGESDHSRTGFFFADSDAYKWLEAACRIQAQRPNPVLKTKIDRFSALIQEAQTPDGYLFTYNQVHFPGQRWVALALEHELYCHGHLIEACLAHAAAFPNGGMLDAAILAAERICQDFLDQAPHRQPGHQEIELVLLRLYEATGIKTYLNMARQFLQRRGREKAHLPRLLGDTLHSARRGRQVTRQRRAHAAAHPDQTPFSLPPMNHAPAPLSVMARFIASAASGKYFQTHRPIEAQNKPVGHAVRFGYTMAAQTRLLRLEGRSDQILPLESLWTEMVTRRMYLTGGLGSLPVIEGFGRDDELDPKMAYAETCAAIASLLWNWELTLAAGRPRYADLFEWQLYNAVLVGVGLEGKSYLYNNTLCAAGDLTRQPWFRIPCCPSNLSRIFAQLGRFAATWEGETLTLQQYFSGEMTPKSGAPLRLAVESGFPWETTARINVLAAQPGAKLRLRVPGWAVGVRLTHNDQPLGVETPSPEALPCSGGFSPFGAAALSVPAELAAGDRLDVHFENPIRPLTVLPRAKPGPANTALTRGPLVYCLESVDNPGLDLDNVTVDVSSLRPAPSHWRPEMTNLEGQTVDGQPLTLIPYFAWANRGPAQMRVLMRVG